MTLQKNIAVKNVCRDVSIAASGDTASRYCHGENPKTATDPLDDSGVRASIERTLTLADSF